MFTGEEDAAADDQVSVSDVTEATVSVHVYQSVYLSAQTPDP